MEGYDRAVDYTDNAEAGDLEAVEAVSCLTAFTMLDGQTAEMVGDTMDTLEEAVGLMLQAHKGYPPAMLDLRELALTVHNLRMLLAESGVYNPTVEPGWLLKQRG